MLRELQHAFARGLLLDEPESAYAYLAPGPRWRARLGVHRNTVAGSLVGALGDTFPATVRALGEADFREAARAFTAVRPPRRPALLAWGAEFPEFLRHVGLPAAPLWIGDLAALEWARNVALFAREGRPLAPADLAALAPGAHAELRLALLPGASIVRSRWPVATLRRRLAAGEKLADEPETVGEAVLVRRRGGEVEDLVLGPGEACLLEGIRDGLALGAAAARALAAAPELDLERAFARALAGGWLAGREAAPAAEGGTDARA